MAFSQAREPISTPLFAANALVDEEEAGGIVLLFHSRQPRIIRSPERLRPGTLEEIALRDIGSRLGRHFKQLIHRAVHSAGMPAGDGQIGSIARNSWKHRGAAG